MLRRWHQRKNNGMCVKRKFSYLINSLLMQALDDLMSEEKEDTEHIYSCHFLLPLLLKLNLYLCHYINI